MPNNQAHLEPLLLKSKLHLTYRSEIIHMDFQNIGVDTFSAENIRNCEEYVLSIQRRLDKVVADNDKKGIRELFDLLTKRSTAVKILATYRITSRNSGKYTAGIDGMAIPKDESRQYQNHLRHQIMSKINIDKKPDSIRRVFIPKPNGDKRPLGIPTIHDRIIQEILRIGLDPIVEFWYNSNSYGFRPRRSCQDAMIHLYLKLAKPNGFRYVIDADIKGCFDNIKHDHIIETLNNWAVPKWATENINRILKTKIFHNGEIYDSKSGTPQGGVISPLLANVALTTLDNLCKTIGRTNPIVRYADDFVITTKSHNHALEIKETIKEHLLEKVGLNLSEEKTEIRHITDGFNFLGFNFRKYKSKNSDNFKLLIKPQKEKYQKLIDTCKEVIKNHKMEKQANLIQMLNPKLIGWGMYYRHVVSSETFHKADFILWRILYGWSKRRHPNKSKKWIVNKYFQRASGKSLIFKDKDDSMQLTSLSKIPIKRFTMVNKNRVYDKDPVVIGYWKMREYLNAFNQIESIKRSRLFSNQKGICPHCKGTIKQQDIQEQGTHVHHVIPRSKGGTDNYSNLRLIHTECHRETQSIS